MKFQRILLWLNCFVFLLYGLGFVFFPANLALLVTDTTPQSTSGLIDMRATYGGMSIAIGLVLGFLAKEATTMRLGIISVMFVMAGMAGGRLIGIFMDGNPNGAMVLYLVLEILVIILAFVSLRIERKQ